MRIFKLIIRKLYLLVIPLFLCHMASAQRTISDTLWFDDGRKITCKIGKIGKKNILYSQGDHEYVKIKAEGLVDYHFHDKTFSYTEDHRPEVIRVIPIPGFNKDELYRALSDWVRTNSEWFSGEIYKDAGTGIILGRMSTDEFIKPGWMTFLEAISPDNNITQYSLHYDIGLRVKDNRAKIYLADFQIVGTGNGSPSKTDLMRLVKHKVYKNGGATEGLKTLITIRKLLENQIESIRAHAEYVKLYDTWEGLMTKKFYADDDW